MVEQCVRELTDVCVVPYLFSKDVFYGGIEAAKACGNGRLRSTDVPVERPGRVAVMRGTHLYAGPLWNHFGHIFVDSLHRLWAYADKYDTIVFNGVIGLCRVLSATGLKTWGYPPYVDEILDLMGIRAKICIVRTPTVFEHLAVPRPGFHLECGVAPFYRKHLKRYQERVEAAVTGFDAPEKLYYSRTHLIKTHGGIIGASYFEKILRESGFVVYKPELHSIRQQFANVLKARVLVFDEGSSIHVTSLLHAVPAKLFMFPRRRDIGDFTRSLRPKGDLTVLADAENTLVFKNRFGQYQPNCASTYRDVAAVFDALRANGLVTGTFDKRAFFALKLTDFMEAESGYAGILS